jgi:plastocyanin
MQSKKLGLAGVRLAATLYAVLGSATSFAVTYDVTVGDGWFQPNQVTIQPGDTVRWTNPLWSGPHDVTPDQGDWGSPTGGQWVFERTFTSPGVFPYHCGIHGQPGRPLGDVMNGIITVQAEEQTIPINAGLSDAWYDPATAGQGFFIIVWEETGLVFLSWFTYDTERPPQNVAAHIGDPGHRWLTAQGAYSEGSAALTVYETAGGVFDAAEPAPGQSRAIGTIDLSWSTCSAGLLAYDLPALSLTGEIPIQRIVSDNVAACESQAGSR